MPLEPTVASGVASSKAELDWNADLSFLQDLDLPDLQEFEPFVTLATASADSSADTAHRTSSTGEDATGSGDPDLEQASSERNSGDAPSSKSSGSLKPSKGQRYRNNKKAAEATLEARLQDLRLAIKSKEAERQEYLKQQQDLEAQAQKAGTDLQARQYSEPKADFADQVIFASSDIQRVKKSLEDRSNKLVLKFAQGETREYTVGELAELPVLECLRLWKGTISELTELLLEAHGDPNTKAGLKVSEALLNWEMLIGAKRWWNRKGLREIFSQPPQALDPGCNPPELTSADWNQVITAMGLSKEQQERLLEARRDHLIAVRKLLTSRKSLLRDLQAVHQQQLETDVCKMTQPGRQYQSLLKQLRDNVDQDLVLYLNLMDACWKKVMTRFQKVYLMVLTWPRSTDLLVLLNHLAVGANEPSTQELLGPLLCKDRPWPTSDCDVSRLHESS